MWQGGCNEEVVCSVTYLQSVEVLAIDQGMAGKSVKGISLNG